MTLPAPVAPRAANPRVQDAPAVEPHVVLEATDEISQFGLGLGRPDFMSDLERHGNDRAWVVRQRRVGQQNQMGPASKAPDDFRHSLLARKLPEKFFDVLNLERPLLEFILQD